MHNLAVALSLTMAAAPMYGVAGSGDRAITEAIVQHEKATLEAFKTHDKKAYANLCLPEFYEITSGGTVNTLADELKELDDYVLRD